jgi:hypothetical protein
MTWDKLTHILRILDAENRLLERADNKAISLLSILGVFMVFFIVYYRIIPVNPITVSLIIIYTIFAVLAIISLIMTVRPRIQSSSQDSGAGSDEAPPSEPAFFAGISRFPNLSGYRKTLDEMTKDEAAMVDVYTRQIYSLAMINAAKYKNVQRAVFLVIIALVVELAITAYLFIFYLGSGIMPPIR